MTILQLHGWHKVGSVKPQRNYYRNCLKYVPPIIERMNEVAPINTHLTYQYLNLDFKKLWTSRKIAETQIPNVCESLTRLSLDGRWSLGMFVFTENILHHASRPLKNNGFVPLVSRHNMFSIFHYKYLGLRYSELLNYSGDIQSEGSYDNIISQFLLENRTK